MPLTRRERVRAATINEIKDTARQQIAEHGAAALSLRAIAREMGMTAPALYRYFCSRDDLVTALIVDAYHSLAEALASARDAHPPGNHTERIIAAANAYREWALTHPEQYDLIFGTPIPDYHAPMEITGPAAAASMSVLIQVLDAAYQDGKLSLAEPSPALLTLLQPWADKLDYAGPPTIIHLALAHWAQIHGLVSLELFGHLTATPECGDVDPLFEAEIRALVSADGDRVIEFQQITQLDHLVLTVQDIEETCRFYEDALGMETIAFGAGRKALRFGSQKINLHAAGKEFEPKALRPVPGSEDLCFLTSTPLDEVIAHLRAAKIEIIEGPVERMGAQAKLLSIYVRDPDGNLIEISNTTNNKEK